MGAFERCGKLVSGKRGQLEDKASENVWRGEEEFCLGSDLGKKICCFGCFLLTTVVSLPRERSWFWKDLRLPLC